MTSINQQFQEQIKFWLTSVSCSSAAVSKADVIPSSPAKISFPPPRLRNMSVAKRRSSIFLPKTSVAFSVVEFVKSSEDASGESECSRVTVLSDVIQKQETEINGKSSSS